MRLSSTQGDGRIIGNCPGFPRELAGVLAGVMALLLTVPLHAQENRQPTLKIFPTQVIDNVKETSDAARNLEDNLQGVIEELDRQQKLYKESACEGAPDDEGCAEISRQMARTYKQMLDVMEDELPAIESRVELTRKTLSERLARELGGNRTGADLQELLHEGAGSGSTSQGTRVPRDGMRLSDRFRQYLDLVSQSNEQSVALLGAQMYLDMEETSELIALTRQQIRRGQLFSNLSEAFGTITPRMETTVSEVKRVLFGEVDGSSGTRSVPTDLSPAQQEGYCSEFDPYC